MTNVRQYINLNIELRDHNAAAKQFNVALLPGGAGGVAGFPAITINYNLADIQWILDELNNGTKSVPIEDLIELGTALTGWLLPAGALREAYNKAVADSGQDGGVRLRLIIRSLKLAQLPWELAYDYQHAGEKNDSYFLALNPQISIVRYEAATGKEPSLQLKNPTHLRMVAATANVKGMTPLQLDRERKVIAEVLSNFNVDGVTIAWEPFVVDVTPDELGQALKPGADLFHFAGHGQFEKQTIDEVTGEPTGEGQLVLVSDKQSRQRTLLPAKDVAASLQRAGVRLAVLGACDTGRRDGISPWTAVAPALLERGIPAVVAMQYKVHDEAAVVFSQAFYAALAAGLSVDEGVSDGRRAMKRVKAIPPDSNVEWAIPVLYMSSKDGIIFQELSERESPTRMRLRARAYQDLGVVEETADIIGITVNQKALVAEASLESQQAADTVKGKMTGIRIEKL